MDKKMLKEIMKKKLESEYIRKASVCETYTLDAPDFRQTCEAYAAIALLDSCEDPYLALFLAEKMNFCSDIFCDASFWSEIISVCCTENELKLIKTIRTLSIWNLMTEQEKEEWCEEAVGLLEKWDRSAKRGIN